MNNFSISESLYNAIKKYYGKNEAEDSCYDLVALSKFIKKDFDKFLKKNIKDFDKLPVYKETYARGYTNALEDLLIDTKI
jgi:hypothetical protein